MLLRNCVESRSISRSQRATHAENAAEKEKRTNNRRTSLELLCKIIYSRTSSSRYTIDVYACQFVHLRLSLWYACLVLLLTLVRIHVTRVLENFIQLLKKNFFILFFLFEKIAITRERALLSLAAFQCTALHKHMHAYADSAIAKSITVGTRRRKRKKKTTYYVCVQEQSIAEGGRKKKCLLHWLVRIVSIFLFFILRSPRPSLSLSFF